VVAGVLLAPAGLVVAQQFWQSLTVPKLAFIKVNAWPEGAPSPAVSLIGTVLPPIPARDVADARSRVQYEARLPRQGVLAGSPRLSTTFSLAAGTVIKVADLRLALQKAGVTDVTVPSQWDGAQVALHTSGVVLAQWPDAVLAQSLPLTISAPAGFDFAAFSAVVLRVMGVSPDEAARLAREAGTAPPWLVPLEPWFDKLGRIEQVPLNSGVGTLVEQANAGKKPRVMLAWVVPDRVYVIDGSISRELAIAMANAIQ
jgi:hypothetical protein